MSEVAQNDEAIAIDARAKECARFAQELRELKVSDEPAYNKALARLKQAIDDPKITPLTAAKAMAVLGELEIDTTKGLTEAERDEILEALQRSDEAQDDTKYMGNEEIFVPIEDAREAGELHY